MDTRKAKGAGERGAGVQSSAPVVTVLPKAGRVWFTGDTQRRVLGQSRGSSTHKHPPELQGSGSTCTDPLHKDQQSRSIFPGHTSHRGSQEMKRN